MILLRLIANKFRKIHNKIHQKILINSYQNKTIKKHRKIKFKLK